MKILRFTDRLLSRLRGAPQKIAWTFRYWMAFGRWMPVLSVCLIALSIGSCMYVLEPLREQVLESTERLESESLKMPERVASVQLKQVDAERWGELFPKMQERTASLDAIFDAAPKHNLYLTQAQFHWAEKLEVKTKSGLQALKIDMPVKGGYRDIREYIGDVLQHNPSLALDAVDIAREAPMSARLLVNLRFTLYLRGSL